MKCIAFVDTSCLLWDANDYEADLYKYTQLKDQMINLFDIFKTEMPHFLIREELINEYLVTFPYQTVNSHLHDYNFRVLDFISNIPQNSRVSYLPKKRGTSSKPILRKNHFSANTNSEISYVVSHIHHSVQRNECFFSHRTFFGPGNNLYTVKSKKKKKCTTVFFDDETVLNNYFAQFKRVFDGNPVHHTQNRPGSRKSRLRCYRGGNKAVPQNYLNLSIWANNRYYFYDPIHEVYLVFLRHDGTKYHGHEEEDKNAIPYTVKHHFNVW